MPDFPTIDRTYIAERLTNQAPRSDVVAKTLDAVTEAAIEFGDAIVKYVPPGPDQMLAIQGLEDLLARMKKGIALNQNRVDPEL